jgi:hypothetical protein
VCRSEGPSDERVDQSQRLQEAEEQRLFLARLATGEQDVSEPFRAALARAPTAVFVIERDQQRLLSQDQIPSVNIAERVARR